MSTDKLHTGQLHLTGKFTGALDFLRHNLTLGCASLLLLIACINFSFTAVAQAALTSPAAGSVLPGPAVTFNWSPADGATGYTLRLGSTPGGNNLYGSGLITAISVRPTILPTDGSTIYARLITSYGTNQAFTDYTFRAATRAALTSPAAGSVLPGPAVTFNWSPADGATGYTLRLGSTPGGNNLYGSGLITGISVRPTILPTDGSTIYAQLITSYGTLQAFTNYAFTAARRAALTSPAAGSVLPGPAVTFNWSPADGATGYTLRLGSTPGGNNLYGSGLITGISVRPTILPTDGSTIYAQLITSYGTLQAFTNYAFTAATRAALTSPAAGSVLPGPAVTFYWSPADGATGYTLRLGSTPGGNNLYGSGLITAISVRPTILPTDGSTIYVQLITNYGTLQAFTNYTFTAATRAVLASPAAGSVLPGPAVTFYWSPADGATGYTLRLGSTPGGNNLYGSGLITAISVRPTILPTDGSTIYVQLITSYGTLQAFTNYTFTAATQSPKPLILNLAPGFVVAGSGAQDLTVIGSGFIPATTATYAGASHPLIYVNSKTIVIPLTASDQASLGTRVITLTNPPPYGGSVSVTLPVLMVSSNMLALSQLAAGNQSRMQRLIEKGRNGQPVTFAAIGGSITSGAKASDWAHNYPFVLRTWWQTIFPSSAMTVVNAGVGATESDYGTLRVSRDVLAHNPDLVLVEYAVNDRDAGTKYNDTYEGLVRQLLDAPSHPAVVLLFMSTYFAPVDDWKNTAQQSEATIGANYDTPMVSYHDAITPELVNGTIPVDMITPDGTHPNDLGHAYTALFLQTALQNAMDRFAPGSSPDPTPVTATPLYSDHFEFTSLEDGLGNHGPALKPTGNSGWTAEASFSDPALGGVPEGLQSSTPGRALDFTVNGTDILIGYWNIKGPMGEVSVTVDGALYPTLLEAWGSQTWGGFRGEARVATGLSPGNHQVHLELLSSQHVGSTGTTFRILSVGTGGTQTSSAQPGAGI